MIKTYFKVAFRQLAKNKGYSFLNILGLSLGMACAMLIVLWVHDEYRYDRFHKDHAQLYQVMENQRYEGKTYTFAALPGKFGPAIKAELPEIKYSARADWGSSMLFTIDEKTIYEKGYFTDPDFLKMFSFKLIKGDAATLLTDLTSVVITDKMAERFFGTQDPIGKTLKVNNDKLVTVTGVLEEPPPSSTLQFSWLAPFSVYEKRNPQLESWGNNGIQNFVKLNEGTDLAQVNQKLYGFISSKDTTAMAKPFLFSINDWRLRSRFVEGKQAGGRIDIVNLFSVIAILIIIIACINFMNLATARSEQRAREVGVRKAMGAGRGMLIRQFFGESIFMALAAMVIAALLVWLILPAFNTLVDKKLYFNLTDPVIGGGLLAMALVCGLLAGSYPSLYLSSFNPVAVFKGLRIGKNSVIVFVRKGLVVSQFVISIVLIISTLIVYRQLRYVKDRQLGYNKENVLYTSLRGTMRQHFPAIRNELMATGVVNNAAISNSRVLNIGSSSSGFDWQGKAPNSELLISMDWVSPEYIPTMGMEMKWGRNFYDDIVSDSSSVIINETFANIIGKEDPVGSVLSQGDGSGQLRIVGVVKDYVYNDMYRQPDPLVIFCDTSTTARMLVRLKSNQDIASAVAKVEAVVKANSPGYPVEFRFLDDEFNNMFKSEALIGKLSRVFAFLTILISCLGLFGLAAYTAERRTKEIGIRKVLGATISHVIALLSKDFIQLVAIASVIAFPLAWWAMSKFLEGFAYRISIQWWYFALAGIMAAIVALFTVSFQAVKAAVANPVKSLRTE